MKQEPLIVIPARYESSRFPGKPLANILGKSLIQRVWDTCHTVANTVVATDDARIMDHCLSLDIPSVMTSSSCLTGTDRVYEASKKYDTNIIINVQGDEPLVSKDDIQTILRSQINNPFEIHCGMCSITSEADFWSNSVPKVVTGSDKNLLYISRASIPCSKHWVSSPLAKRQVCIYGFSKSLLSSFYAYGEKTPLEQVEDIEILRFVELGFSVRMVEVSSSSIAVDYPKDIERVSSVIKLRNMDL